MQTEDPHEGANAVLENVKVCPWGIRLVRNTKFVQSNPLPSVVK